MRDPDPHAPSGARDPHRARAPLILPGRYAAAVFDMDGLLVDSEPSWAEAEGALFAARGLPFGPADIADTHGRSVQATVELYAEHLGRPADALFDELLTEMRRRYATEVPLRPGARDLVLGLAGRMGLAVASNSPAGLVDAGLRHHGLAEAIDVVVSGHELGRSKPDPEVYRVACRELGVDPTVAIAFEDSAPGVTAAKAAGLACVGIPERPAVDLSGADLVIASLADVVVEPD